MMLTSGLGGAPSVLGPLVILVAENSFYESGCMSGVNVMTLHSIICEIPLNSHIIRELCGSLRL